MTQNVAATRRSAGGRTEESLSLAYQPGKPEKGFGAS